MCLHNSRMHLRCLLIRCKPLSLIIMMCVFVHSKIAVDSSAHSVTNGNSFFVKTSHEFIYGRFNCAVNTNVRILNLYVGCCRFENPIVDRSLHLQSVCESGVSGCVCERMYAFMCVCVSCTPFTKA